jgi:hypothetical protein
VELLRAHAEHLVAFFGVEEPAHGDTAHAVAGPE